MPPIVTSLLLLSSVAPSTFEQWVVFTANLTAVSSFPGGPTGSVTFWDGPVGTGLLLATVPLTPLTGFTGEAQMQIASLTGGIHGINAQYSGDANFAGVNSNTVVQQVNDVITGGASLGGFGLIAEFDPTGDSLLPPQATLFSVPASTVAHTSVTLIWYTLNVPFIRITGNNTFDYQAPPPPGSLLGFDTGFISTTGSGIYVVGNGFTHSITLTLTAYDGSLTPLGLTSSTVVTIT